MTGRLRPPFDRVLEHVENTVVLETADSTHAMALRLIEQMAQENLHLRPTVILAGSQSAGRGRRGRRWLSPTGGLYLDWLASDLEPATAGLLPALAAAAAIEALDEAGVPGAGVKWPNDLLLAGAKLGGILVHARRAAVTWAAVGLGINITVAPELPAGAILPATAVADHVPVTSPDGMRAALAAGFAAAIAAAIEAPAELVTLWRTRLVHRPGDRLVVRTGSGRSLSGRFVGVTGAGHLRLEVGGEVRTFPSGEIVETDGSGS